MYVSGTVLKIDMMWECRTLCPPPDQDPGMYHIIHVIFTGGGGGKTAVLIRHPQPSSWAGLLSPLRVELNNAVVKLTNTHTQIMSYLWYTVAAAAVRHTVFVVRTMRTFRTRYTKFPGVFYRRAYVVSQCRSWFCDHRPCISRRKNRRIGMDPGCAGCRRIEITA